MASTQIASTSTAPFTAARRNGAVRVAPRKTRTQHTIVSALPKQDNAQGASGNSLQKALTSGAKFAVSLAAAQLALSGAALADLPPQINQNADFGPNEVSKQTIKDTSVGADNPFDQAAPGRSGGLFGGAGAGKDEPGAVDPSKVKEKGSDLVDKVKSALPFQTLPVFDLAEEAGIPGGDSGIEAYQSPPQENENADLGPNEVTKSSIGDISKDAANPFDTAAPGRAGQTFGENGPGSGDTGAVDPSEVKDKALKASSLFDKLKAFLPFGTLPVYDVSVAPDAKNLGPNEITKGELAKLPGADNKFDTATPGRAGEGLDSLKKEAPRAASDVIKDALKKVGN